MGLNKREMAFVAEYIKEPTATQKDLARRAGYKGDTKVAGHRLMKSPKILEEIKRRTEGGIKRLTSSNLADEDIIDGLLKLVDICERAGPGSWQVAGATRALELLARIRKMLSERVEVGFNDELMAALLEGRKRVQKPPELKPAFIDALPAPKEEAECQQQPPQAKPN